MEKELVPGSYSGFAKSPKVTTKATKQTLKQKNYLETTNLDGYI